MLVNAFIDFWEHYWCKNVSNQKQTFFGRRTYINTKHSTADFLTYYLQATCIKQSRATEIFNAIPSSSLAGIAKLQKGININT